MSIYVYIYIDIQIYVFLCFLFLLKWLSNVCFQTRCFAHYRATSKNPFFLQWFQRFGALRCVPLYALNDDSQALNYYVWTGMSMMSIGHECDRDILRWPWLISFIVIYIYIYIVYIYIYIYIYIYTYIYIHEPILIPLNDIPKMNHNTYSHHWILLIWLFIHFMHILGWVNPPNYRITADISRRATSLLLCRPDHHRGCFLLG